jgi:hypothetical protein
MTKEVYLDILKDDLYHILDDYGIETTKVIFQQDNDPKHRANLVEEWLSQQPFEVMQWPPQSSDLNPIENTVRDKTGNIISILVFDCSIFLYIYIYSRKPF